MENEVLWQKHERNQGHCDRTMLEHSVDKVFRRSQEPA